MKPSVMAFDAHRLSGGVVRLGWCVCTIEDSNVIQSDGFDVCLSQTPLNYTIDTSIRTMLRTIQMVNILGGQLATECCDNIVSLVLFEMATLVGWRILLPPVLIVLPVYKELARHYDAEEHSMHIAKACCSQFSVEVSHRHKRPRLD
jgi:hypothetical protein